MPGVLNSLPVSHWHGSLWSCSVSVSLSAFSHICHHTWQPFHKLVRDWNIGCSSSKHIRIQGLSCEWIQSQLCTYLWCLMYHGAVGLPKGFKSEGYGVDLESQTRLSFVTDLVTSYFAGIEINSWSSWILRLLYYIPGSKGKKEI